jgi:hypothetical protein
MTGLHLTAYFGLVEAQQPYSRMDMIPTLNITIDERHCHGLGPPKETP